MEDNHKNLIYWVIKGCHSAIVLAGLMSGTLLYHKFRLSNWDQPSALGGAFFLAIVLIVVSEALGILFFNLLALLLQKEKPLGEVKQQIVFNTVSLLVT